MSVGIGATADIAESLHSVLERGERLLWSGRPRQGMMLRSSDAGFVPFSLLWCGFAVYWEYIAFSRGAPAFFLLWGVPFILVGLHIVLGRFIVDALLRTRTIYAVTDRRVLIITQFLRRRRRVLTLEGLSEIDIDDRPGGRGTLSFGRGGGFAGGPVFRGWPGSARYLPPAFEEIERPDEVLRIIRDAQRALRNS
jgi:hypothetical protein